MDPVLSTTNNPASLNKKPSGTFSFSGSDETLQPTSRESDVATSSAITEANQMMGFTPIPDEIDSALLGNDLTTDDLISNRSQLEAQQAAPSASTQIDSIETQATGPIDVFGNPEGAIDRLLSRDITEAEQDYQDILNRRREYTSNIESQLTEAERRARKEIGYFDKEDALSQTEEDIAARTVRFRRDIRNLETDATRRGRARQFMVDEVQKVEADARAELADLYIIQNAQQGNLARAEQYIQSAVDNRYRSYEIQLAQSKADLDALLPTLEKEDKERALQLQIALGERERNLQTAKEEDAARRQLLMTAAANGAGKTAQQAILNATSMDEAYLAAGPWIGRYDRMKVEADLASKALDRRKKLVELALAGDENSCKQLGSLCDSIKQQLNDAQTAEDRAAMEQVINNSYNLANNSAIARRLQSSPAFGAVTGSVQNNPFLTIGGTALAGGAATAAAGSVVPGVGTVAGGVLGTVAGLASGTYSYMQTERAREDFFDDVEALSSRGTLQTLIDAKANGATFGALSNAELGLLIQATNDLSSKLIKDPDTGEVTGITGTPEAVRAAINQVVSYYERAENENYKNALGGDAGELDLVLTQ